MTSSPNGDDVLIIAHIDNSRRYSSLSERFKGSVLAAREEIASSQGNPLKSIE